MALPAAAGGGAEAGAGNDLSGSPSAPWWRIGAACVLTVGVVVAVAKGDYVSAVVIGLLGVPPFALLAWWAAEEIRRR